jgi:hypothetical protein
LEEPERTSETRKKIKRFITPDSVPSLVICIAHSGLNGECEVVRLRPQTLKT